MNPFVLADSVSTGDSENSIWLDVLANPTDPLNMAIIIVAALIIVVALFSGCVSIYLAIKYVKYNKMNNSAHMTGEEAARKLLDQNGLQDIRVSKNGSILFGNSYSHYFHKVRLRRRTWKKQSVASIAMAAQKTGLAVLDKEGDKDMKTRIVLTPITIFGPYAFVPLIVIGVVIDMIIFNGSSLICTLVASLIGIAFFVLSFVLQIIQLKTEVKAQNKAYEMLKANNMATEQELDDMKYLFKLYNIEYINDIVIAFLEVVYRVLMIVASLRGSSNSSTSSD